MSVLVPTKFPSVAAIMLACIASLFLLFLARIMYAFMRLWSCPPMSTTSDEKTRAWSSLLSLSNTWSRSLRSALPASLPFSLTILEKPSPEVGTGVGIGFSPKRLESQPGSQFQSHPPASYQNPAPLSMAKLIMSRHTFRRPNPNRPRRSSTASRPPQPTSQLFHSIA
ncbi:hypothetical protein M405DRAFT_855419 [Rhizopogon salebrosus TDB-379]|nr:hypothetical protein M405DRAFT_855419 [Rhizopogon salebrosus TDB-379]